MSTYDSRMAKMVAEMREQIEQTTAIAKEATSALASRDRAMDALRADNTALQNDVIAPLRERVKVLETALEEAADSIADWGAYASEYFQQKHGLKSCIDAARAALEPKP